MRFLRYYDILRARIPLIAALVLLALYVALVVLAYNSTTKTGTLAFRVSFDDDTPRVSWVMPAGIAWDEGVRPDMKVISIDGKTIENSDLSSVSVEQAQEAVFLTSTGEKLYVEQTETSISHGAARFSLWLVGGVFILLGITVMLRRPDFRTARMFALFTGFAAIAFAVGPSAGGPGFPWAITVQYMSVLGIGATFPLFVFALLDVQSKSRWLVTSSLIGFSLTIAACFGISILVRPTLYEVVQPVLFLFISLVAIGSVVLLSIIGQRQKSQLSREQARICLWGTALGTLPFVSLTLIPEALVNEALLPAHITVIAFALMPVFFGYAILQHQLLGIRKLVYRGTVYGTTTIVLLFLVVLTLTAIVHPFDAPENDNDPTILIPLVIVGGIIIFFPLQRGARWLVDKFLYKDTADYQAFLKSLPVSVGTLSGTTEIATGIVQPLAHALNLESVHLFLNEGSYIRMVASVGERATDNLALFQSKIERYMENQNNKGLVELRLKSDTFIIANLELPGHRLGFLLLGPKQGGEVLVEDEKQFVASVVPIITLAIDKAELSDELRNLNQRLVKAEETERARIAGDLHDGPLQKIIFLAREPRGNPIEKQNIAKEIISEIREICSRLRPAILDDLGLVPALEWLLDDVSKHSDLLTQLSLNDINEEDRFAPDIEQALFRITQEALNNAIKHAKASSLNITISRAENLLTLQVSDNGSGFSPGSNNKKGFGLSGMRERAYSVGGSFNIYSTPGDGTTVVASIPFRLNSLDEGSPDGAKDKSFNS